MPRLYRPYIPLKTRCQVAERQLVRLGHPKFVTMEDKHFAHRLGWLLRDLATRLGCEVSDLRLDHDPPLAARPCERRGLGRKTYYMPDANDPAHLHYRPHGAQFEGSHDVKTRIRGEHGQFSDLALIKRKRRHENPKLKKKHKWASRPFRRKA